MKVFDTAGQQLLGIGVDTTTSNALSVLSQGISVVSQALSVETANRVSAANALSQAISVVSQAISVLSQATSVANAGLSVRADTISNAVSVLSQATSVVDAALSVRIDTQSQSISVLSKQVSALSQKVSGLSVIVGPLRISGNLSVEGTFFINGIAKAFIGDTTNANMTIGLTINQGAADNQILALKSSDVAHGLISGWIDQETDDFLVIQKFDPLFGGANLVVTAEDAATAVVFTIATLGGTADTTDDTTSRGLLEFVIAEHDGAGALINAPVNQNVFVIRARGGVGAFQARLLLKGDDGELHLGNSTLVALDAEDDVQAVRALQIVRTGGHGIIPTPYDRPIYDYERLRDFGVVGERDARGEFLIRVQPYLSLHDGAIWQLYTRYKKLETRHAILEGKMQAFMEGRA